MGKKSRKSATKWEQASERALIAIWSNKMTELRGCRKNSHILVDMVAELQNQGLFYTVVELKTKMHNLTSRYRKEKQKVGITGGSPSEWDLFQDMQTLLAPFKSYHCENLLQESVDDINFSVDVFSPPPSPSTASQFTYTTSPLSSPSVPSSPPLSANSPLASTDMSPPSPLPSSSNAKRKKKDTLFNVLKKVEINMEKCLHEMKRTSQKLLEVEEEKKNIIKKYVDREAVVQKALVAFLRRQK